VTWFRRAQDRARDAVAPEDDPEDRPDALLGHLFDLVRQVNRDAGRLPAEAVVDARRVLDAVRLVVASADDRPLDVRAVVAVRGILGDYLPTTLRTYLALDPAVVDVPRPSGRTPRESLIEQLETLEDSATDLLDAIRAQDADAMLSQGSFLRTKFARSDLDL
jgi:hypothetical protein